MAGSKKPMVIWIFNKIGEQKFGLVHFLLWYPRETTYAQLLKPWAQTHTNL